MAACSNEPAFTEVTSSVYRDGTDVVNSLVMGTYVVFETDSAYSEECFREYSMLPDKSGKYASLYRPIHMIGLELGLSAASAALRKEATGSPICFNADVIATAKRKLKAGEMLDGEGGFCVWGKQTPAKMSLAEGYLPLGLAHQVKLKTEIAEGQRLKWSDVEYDPNDLAVKVRREMESNVRSKDLKIDCTSPRSSNSHAAKGCVRLKFRCLIRNDHNRSHIARAIGLTNGSKIALSEAWQYIRYTLGAHPIGFFECQPFRHRVRECDPPRWICLSDLLLRNVTCTFFEHMSVREDVTADDVRVSCEKTVDQDFRLGTSALGSYRCASAFRRP